MFELKTRKTIVCWPAPQDYNEAVQNPAVAFNDTQLRLAEPGLDMLGLPRPVSGAFASVYRLQETDSDKALPPTTAANFRQLLSGKRDHSRSWAVRCFLRHVDDQEDRYTHISNFLKSVPHEHIVSFDYLARGIKVNSSWFPVLKMDWVDGPTLEIFIEENLGSRAALKALPSQFLEMYRHLQSTGMAHGDLQHGNILVTSSGLRLVDYDGMFVPGMEGLFSNELGHSNYQHPGRQPSDFGPALDNFSAWVIYVSLEAIAVDSSLYSKLGGGADCLLFRRDDFVRPEQSRAFAELESHSNERISLLARFLRSQIYRRNSDVEPLLVNPPVVTLPDLDLESRTSAEASNPGGVVVAIPRGKRRVKEDGALQQSDSLFGADTVVVQVASASDGALAQPLPRRVKPNPIPGRLSPLSKQVICFFIPHFWVLIVAGVMSLSTLLVCAFGHDLQGTVVSTAETPHVSRNGVTYYTHDAVTAYEKGGSRFYRTENDSRQTLKVGDHVKMRTLEGVPWGKLIQLYADQPMAPPLWQLVAFPLMLVGVGLLEVALWRDFFRQLALVRKGNAVVGKVTDKRAYVAVEGVTASFAIDYEFSVFGSVYRSSMIVNSNTYAFADKDTTITVLYDRKDPSNSCLYKYAFVTARG